ncbi:peptide-binding protein [Enterocloster clostridioformis]|uniref:SH3 domain-containing protein n=1 Tax=Enterocloster clostridioformis TaxID=1531 RepID=UPI00080C8F28|nr:SH3 domain-containing protein [Enterocloster clostridioformis]ANU49989.1 peptide-binding protein [Lachnoclostridium sp. YL32]NDO28519.1 SH3 domain-containing protein [Enterocloster clostridioformis]OXE70950.1 peptide-binding protein [Enterocloster clostridioformis]QQR01104.1 SH3 domain-containing protein [Enterocloster clostridioformis]
MKGKKLKRGLALVLGLMLAAEVPASVATPFKMFDSYAYTGAATVKATSLNVRSGAGTGYSSVGRLAAGAAVTVIGEQRGTDGNTWYQIQYTGTGGAVNTGYVSSLYIRLPVAYTTDSNFEAYLTSQGFPESYKNGLRQLHAQYPNWVFKAKNTGLDWNTVIENESVLGRNLVATGSVSSWKSVANGAYNWDNSTWTGFDGSSWVAASEDIIRYYMDPRNFLDETYVFQFLNHEYDANTQTKEGLNSLINGSFLSGTTNSTGTGGSDFSSGPGSSSEGPGSGGPGSSGSSSGSSEGPGRSSTYEDTQHGPGVSGSSNGSGSAAVSPGGSSSGSSSPSGSGEVSLESPHASIEPRERNIVSTSVSLVAPGQDGSGSSSGPVSPGQSGSGTSSGPVASPASENVVDQTGTSPGGGSTGAAAPYADIIMAAASQSGVSPYVLAAMILQEQGNNGTSPLISGSYSGYEGYYNFFNVEAYQSGAVSAIEMGLRFASQSGSYGRPWNTVEKAIRGGAQNYGDNYVKAGQNTFYLKKFNVQGSNLYKHQYMSNIQGAASEAAKLSQAYTSDLKKTALEFHIPVFNNMPEQPCVAPAGDGSPNNKLSGLGVDGFNLTPSFNRDTQEYNLIVDSSVSNITVSAYASDSNARVDGAGNVSLQNGGNDISIAVTAQNGSVRTYTIHVVKQDGGPTQGSAGSPVYGGGSFGGTVSPDGSSGGSGGPGGSNVTIVEVQS